MNPAEKEHRRQVKRRLRRLVPEHHRRLLTGLDVLLANLRARRWPWVSRRQVIDALEKIEAFGKGEEPKTLRPNPGRSEGSV